MTADEPPDSEPTVNHWTSLLAWASGIGADWVHALQVLVLLTALTFIVHKRHWLPDFEAAVLSTVSSMRAEGSDLALTTGASMQDPWITLLEFTAESRVGTLEYKGELLPAEIERLGGVRPIDRDALALALEQLARRLKAILPPGKRPLVAIDIDVAPLESQPDGARIRNALNALREQADVVAITLSRSDDGARQARFAFMRADCTRLDKSPGRKPSPASAVPEAAGQANKGGLFFASSTLLAEAGQPVYGYPFLRKHAAAPGAFTSPLFPSLGNLIYAHRCSSHTGNADCALSPQQAAEALTAYCEAAHQSVATPSRFPEDQIADPAQQGLAVKAISREYEKSLMNSRLQNSAWFRESVVPMVSTAASAPHTAGQPDFDGIGAHLLNSPVLLLSVNGGAGHDKHLTASGGVDPWTGARLHAVTALSGRQPLRPATWLSVLLDFVFGSLFVLLWAVVKPVPDLPVVKSLRLSLLAAAVLPLVIALALSFGSLLVATRLLERDVWFNPLLLIGGLLLHAYIGQAEAERYAASNHSHKRRHTLAGELLFGAPVALKAWRSPPWSDNGLAWPNWLGAVGSSAVKWAVLGFAVWVAFNASGH